MGRLRATAAAAIRDGAPGQPGELLVGMALGDDSGLPSSTREDFRRSSLTHVTAASGQNIALLLALLLPLLALLGIHHRSRLIACGLVALAYVPLSGAESPIRRACVMALCGLLAKGRGGRASAAHPLLLAVVVTLLIDPAAIHSLGWQLSFSAVTAMLVAGPVIEARLRGIGLPRPLAEAAALTIAATAATSPLIAHAVGRVSLTAIPANLFAAPAVGMAMLLGLAATLVAQASPGVAGAVAAIGALPSAAVLEVARVFAAPGWAAIGFTPSAPFAILLAVGPVVVARLAARRGAAMRSARDSSRRRWAIPMLAAVASCSGLLLLSAGGDRERAPRTAPAVHFLDVGQGDAQLLADGERGILVDTGPPGVPIARLVSSVGVRRLEALVLTHGQADHVGALADLLTRFRPAIVIDGTSTAPGGSSPEVRRLLERHGIRSLLPRPGLRVATGRVSYTVLGPEAPSTRPDATGDPNRSSVVGWGAVGGMTLLLTGDAETESLPGLAGGPVDVLKLAHHGSSDPGLESLLERTRPRITVIQVGRNPYGHPHPSAVSAVARSGRLLRTDRDGTVTVMPLAEGGLEWRSAAPR